MRVEFFNNQVLASHAIGYQPGGSVFLAQVDGQENLSGLRALVDSVNVPVLEHESVPVLALDLECQPHLEFGVRVADFRQSDQEVCDFHSRTLRATTAPRIRQASVVSIHGKR